MPDYHIAQYNLARMRASLGDPIMAEFAANMQRIDEIGEHAPGFVWIFKDDDDKVLSLRPYDDDLIIVNLTVWETIDALFEFTYRSEHTDFFRRRLEWFSKTPPPVFVLWWIEAGQIPTIEQATLRLDYLRQHGPTPYAFTFKKRFTAEDAITYPASI